MDMTEISAKVQAGRAKDVSHIGQAIAENREKREINQMIRQLSWNDVFQIVCEAKSDCKNYHK